MWPTRYPARRPGRVQLISSARLRRRNSAWQRSILSAGLAALVGGTGIWITEALIAPQASQAYTSRLDLFLARETGETYETLIRRAEMAARAGAQRSFDQDLLTTNVSVTVVAEGDGLTVPILTLRVDRDQWRARPETYYWATYYRTAEILLSSPAGTLSQ
ncbi:hypothetical protein BH23CYA1_BH23CYA1_24010 [soil metagenome]|uniref:hypothetical protein n=1 Tax=Leptolyngbya sp. BC1307 TaxID=2029589 RepID=UPI001F0B5F62|nr:hypothetical protein [Leptolyngbya sp. BC1307]